MPLTVIPPTQTGIGAFQEAFTPWLRLAIQKMIQQKMLKEQRAYQTKQREEERAYETTQREKELETFARMSGVDIPKKIQEITSPEAQTLRETGAIPERFKTPGGVGLKLPGYQTPTTPTTQPTTQTGYQYLPTFTGGKVGFTPRRIPTEKKPSPESLMKMAQSEAYRQMGGSMMVGISKERQQRYLDLVQKLFEEYTQKFGTGKGETGVEEEVENTMLDYLDQSW